MTFTEFLEENIYYLLLEENGDIYAEVSLPNTYTLEGREEIMNTLARCTNTKWSEATEYRFEG